MYNAFLSYSHTCHQLAKDLESALRRFATPLGRVRGLRVFRDQSTLPLTNELPTAIEGALAASEFLILLASPAAAASVWVRAEVAHWLTLHDGRAVNVLLVLTEGRIEWDPAAGDFDWERTTALPPALRGAFAREPLYADLTWVERNARLSLRDPRFKNEVASLAAAIRKRPKDDLIGDDVRRQRLLFTIGTVLVTAVLIAGSIAAWQAVLAVRARDQARVEEAKAVESARLEREARVAETAARTAETKAREEAERRRVEAEERRIEAERQADIALSRQLSAQSESIRRQAVNVPLSALLAAQAIKRLESVSSPSFEADTTIRQALALLPQPVADYSSGRLSPDGNFVVARTQGVWTVFEAFTGRRLFALGERSEKVTIVFALGGRALAAIENGTASVYGLPAGEKLFGAQPGPTAPPNIARLRAGEGNEIVTEPAVTRHDSPVALSPDGRRLITITTVRWTVLDNETPGSITREENSLTLWDLAERRQLRSTSLGGHVQFVTFHPDGRQITAVVLVVDYGELHQNTYSVTLNADTLERANSRAGMVSGLPSLEWLRLILRSDNAPRAVVELAADRQPWNVTGVQPSAEKLALDASVVRLRGVSDGSVTAATRTGNEVIISGPTDEHRLPIDRAEYVAAIDPRARLAAIAGPSNLLRIVDVATGEEVARNHHSGVLRAVQLTAEGECRLLTTSADGSVHAWLFGGARETVQPVADRVDVVPRLDAALKGELLGKTVIGLRTMESRQIPPVGLTIQGSNKPVVDRPTSIAFSPDGRFIVTNHFSNIVNVWERASGRQVAALKHPEQGGQSVRAFAFSPEGTYLARVGKEVHVWERWQSAEPRSHRLQPKLPRLIAFSPDARYLAVAEAAGAVRLYAVPGFAEAAVLTHHAKEEVNDFVFSEDGRWLAMRTGIGDQYRDRDHYQSYVEIWNVDQRRLMRRWSHGAATNAILSLDVTADGRYLVTSGGDRTVRLWQAESGFEVVRLTFARSVPDAVFSADGKYVVVRSGDDPRDAPTETDSRYRRVVQLESRVVLTGHSDLMPAVPNERAISRWLWRPQDLIDETCARLRTDLSETDWRLYGGGRSPLAVCAR